MNPLSLVLSEDRTTLTVRTDGAAPVVLTATAVDDLIHRLAAYRSQMMPVHPAEPPVDEASSFAADNLLWSVRPAPQVAALELGIQHAGLGWIVTTLSRAQVEDLQTSIAFTINEMQIAKPAHGATGMRSDNVLRMAAKD
jgi:hypothetical protein